MNTETIFIIGFVLYIGFIGALVYLNRLSKAIYGSKQEQREREAFQRFLDTLNKDTK